MSDRTYYSHDAEMRAQREKFTGVLIFLALGLGIGAALALLFAPESGDKTRHRLGHTINEGIEKGREATNTAIHQVEREVADLRKKLEEHGK